MRRPVLLILLAAPLLASPALPSPALAVPSLRGDVTARRDTLTLGDLVVDAPASLADTPLFRAPPLGQTGTIQARRITAALDGLGLSGIETGGRLQVTITRAARQIGPTEIEAALRRALGTQGFDPGGTGVAFDGAAPLMLLPPDVEGGVEVSDLVLDRRARRLAATVWVGPHAAERRASLRVSGGIVDLVDVPVVTRPLERGETVRAGDVVTESRPRDSAPADVLSDGAPLEGRTARRALAVGTVLRSGDTVRPDLVARGEVVTAVFEAPGMSLSMRLTAQAAGARGDTINVLNPASKKTIQAVVTGPGRVAVGPGARPDPRLASAVAVAVAP